MESRNNLVEFQKIINIKFQNIDYLTEALTHSSYANKSKNNNNSHNERLEFFGDSILKYIVSEHLFKKYPLENEGFLSQLRSKIVSDQFLSKLGNSISLGEHLILSYGESKSGGAQRLSNIANAFEALIGAIYLDQGIESVKIFFFAKYSAIENELISDEFSDFKSRLQEKCQKFKLSIPDYRIIHESGPDHEKTFCVEASVEYDGALLVARGTASTRKKAEQEASKHVYFMFNDLK